MFKLDFKFIFVRIVFNSGVNYMGYVFNEYWVKGLDLFNSLFGIFVWFCENEVVFLGDIKKKYYVVKIIVLD